MDVEIVGRSVLAPRECFRGLQNAFSPTDFALGGSPYCEVKFLLHRTGVCASVAVKPNSLAGSLGAMTAPPACATPEGEFGSEDAFEKRMMLSARQNPFGQCSIAAVTAIANHPAGVATIPSTMATGHSASANSTLRHVSSPFFSAKELNSLPCILSLIS